MVYDAISPIERNLPNIIRPARKPSIILGLIFMGVVVSATIFIIHARVEQLELNLNLNLFLLILLAFAMLPGGLTGVAAGVWINAAKTKMPDYAMNRMYAGFGISYYWPYTSPDITVRAAVEEPQVPAGEMLVYRGTRVEATVASRAL